MKTAFFALLLLCGAASAQFDKADAEMRKCETSCCSSFGGNWSGGACSMAVYTSDYNSCEDRCLQNATGAISGSAPSTSFCCAPAFLLGAVFVFSVTGKGSVR